MTSVGAGLGLFAVGAPGDSSFAAAGGSVVVYSGLGSIVWIYESPGITDNFGWSVADAGDVNGDGITDVVAGAPYHDTLPAGPDCGLVRVLSGMNGNVLQEWEAPVGSRKFGWSVAGLGDLDGDGCSDLAVGEKEDQLPGKDAGSVHVFSGGTGDPLFWIPGDEEHLFLGWAVEGIGDMDGDGIPDLAVGGPGVFVGFTGLHTAGRVHLVSGSSGTPFRTLWEMEPGERFGVSLARLSDLDLDGWTDLAVGAEWNAAAGWNAGAVRVFSIPTGAILHEETASAPLEAYGHAVASAGDLDLDGRGDFIVGAPDADMDTWNKGAVHAWSGGQPVGWFGTGCGGVTASWSGHPDVGSNDLLIQATGCPPASPVVCVVGDSNATWAGAALPLELAPLGAPDCWMLISPDVLLPGAADTAGAAVQQTPVPSSVDLRRSHHLHPVGRTGCIGQSPRLGSVRRSGRHDPAIRLATAPSAPRGDATPALAAALALRVARPTPAPAARAAPARATGPLRPAA
jgi:hypothetical protein